MKTMNNIFKFILAALAVVTFFSCEIPVGLGPKLDIQGPIVTITSPSQRKSVPVQFTIEGTVQDESDISRLLLKAVNENKDFPRQWQYKKGVWEFSDNYGSTWLPLTNASWEGTSNSASWKIPVDLTFIGKLPEEGEYTFSVQAWDKGDFTDDNSYKTIVLIIDRDPPKVDISYPFLFKGAKPYEDDETFKELHEIKNDGKEKQEPAYLGKFFTQEFDLKWQIDDFSQVWSIDLRLYKYDVVIDNNPNTALPADYIYKYSKNTPPPPPNVNLSDYLKPNGSVLIPDLYSATAGIYDQGGELKNPITEKTTIKVVAVCHDAAGIANQEKTIGYFIYWPAANEPWIAFTDGINDANESYGKPIKPDVEEDTFTVFPGKYIKATAYQAHGVKKVEYSVYECAIEDDKLTNNFTFKYEGTIENIKNSADMYSTIFSWQFEVPDLTGYYIFRAKAFSNTDKQSVEYEKLFRVNDITFPNFPSPPEPPASDPLFLSIVNEKIKISGIVSDATQIKSLCLVWINPQSEQYSSMNQLAYFRDKDYPGWKQALTLSPGANDVEKANNSLYGPKYPYDINFPNRLWKLDVTPIGIDQETNRRLFHYEQEINLSELNMGIGQRPLKSQIFLLRAENPAGSCTIITYAPQGDTVLPHIEITNVEIDQNGTKTDCIPNIYSVIPQFSDGNTITINGKWREDSVKTLDLTTYFKNNFTINVNNEAMRIADLILSRDNVTDTEGTWKLTTTVKASPLGGQVPLGSLKDTLVIDAKTYDIGGNIVEIGNSWLIQSDTLKLMRISSEKEDGIYKTGEQIRIFLEFSKPVNLSENFNGTKNQIQLILSSASGNTARAAYQPSNDQNSRQYFLYTVEAGQETTTPEYLNVKGLYYNGKEFNTNDAYNDASYPTTNYPFAWTRGGSPGESGYEEVRLTMQNGNDGKVKEGFYFVRTLPTNTVSGNPDYQYTLFAAKHIKIDTIAPTVVSVKADTAAGYYSAGDIYFTVTFNEEVKLGATAPRFPLIIGTPATGFTSANAANVRVNGKTITFMYPIGANDTSSGNEIYIAGGAGNNYTGSITDIAGNPLAGNAMSSLSQTARTLTGVRIETQNPSPPTVRLLPGNVTANTDNVYSQNVSGNTITGESSTAVKNFTNIYNPTLWLAIQGTGAAYKYAAIEYSIDSGINWVRASNTSNNPFQLTQAGNYKIVARQIDSAGNVSATTNAINFDWDPGSLINRISSDSANGIYTHISGRNEINLTFYFRKPLRIATTTTPTITITAQDSSNANKTVTIPTASIPGGAVNSLTFTYTVANGDKTPANTYVDILTLTGITAWDGNAVNNGVNVSSLITLPTGTPKLDSTKQFTVETGNLSVGTPEFIADVDAGAGYNSETNANFHGIRTDDGSYWTTLEVSFNHTITKGSGNITITQIQGTGTNMYRLPSVMTEAQYNRFKNVSVTVSGNVYNTDTYYIKSTNGYINGTGSDTSTKYVLQYNYDPRRDITANDGFTGNTPIQQEFIDAFCAAEAISINVNAVAVTIEGTGTTTKLKVRLSNSNAPQVPGATYAVSLPAGLVVDSLGNSSALTNTNVALRGAAKPFIRIRKTQDTISTAAGSASAARITAAQPFLAYVRMDCRTPGSSIKYTASSGSTTAPVAAANNFANANHNNWSTTGTPNDTNTTVATRPNTNDATDYTISNQITIGYASGTTSPTIENVQGFQWWARATAAATVSGTSYTSKETEELAYRTVITYQLRSGNNGAITADTGESILADGDQIWVRGGDAVGSSSIPGFPFTWEDNWDNLADKRAGIRLMSLVATSGTTLNNSIWRLVTWEMNANAYVDFIRGHDTASSGNVAWQYGPKEWTYQRNGWTSFKDKYPIYPGKHRWCDTGNDTAPKGAMNFSGTLAARPDISANYNRWPGLNTQ